METVDASEFGDQSKLRLRMGESTTIEGDLELSLLKVGRGSMLEVQGDLTVKNEADVYRNGSRIKITGDMELKCDTRIRRNATIDVNGSLTFTGREMTISRSSRLFVGNNLDCGDSKVKLTRGSRINVEYGDLRCETLNIRDGRAKVLVENGCLMAESVYVPDKNSLVVKEIIADTNPRDSVNDSGKYVDEDEEENDTDLFDVSKDPADSVDVHEYEPDMDTSNLVVWMEAKIMSEAENQEFPFKEFNRVVQQYPRLRNLLGSVTTAQDAKRISEMNGNINLTRYQIDKLENTQEIADREDSDGLDELRRIGEKIDEYNPSAVNQLETDSNQDASNDDDNTSDNSDFDDDSVSAFDW